MGSGLGEVPEGEERHGDRQPGEQSVLALPQDAARAPGTVEPLELRREAEDQQGDHGDGRRLYAPGFREDGMRDGLCGDDEDDIDESLQPAAPGFESTQGSVRIGHGTHRRMGCLA